MTNAVPTLQIDPEAARILIALGYAPGVVLAYYSAKHLDRAASGAGWVEIGELVAFLRGAGATFSDRTMDRWVKTGAGILWDKVGSRLYLYQTTRLSRGKLRGRLNLVKLALDAKRPELVSTNPPGARYVAVPVATGQQFTAYLYAAWLSSRIRPDRLQAFSRFTLGALWGVSRTILQKWERRAGITPVRALAQYDLAVAELIPDHAEPYVVRAGDGVAFRARGYHSNLFARPDAVTRSHARLPRERRRAALVMLENEIASEPARSQAARGFSRTGRLDFYDSTGARRFTPAYKRVRTHLRQHGDHERAHYAHLGIDSRGRHVFEATTGITYTWLDEALPRRAADSVFSRNGGRHAFRSIWRAA